MSTQSRKIITILLLSSFLSACNDAPPEPPSQLMPQPSGTVAFMQNAQGLLRLQIMEADNIELSANQTLELNLNDSLEFVATAENAKGQPAANKKLWLSSSHDNFLTQTQLITQEDGQANTVFIASQLGADELTLTDGTLKVKLLLNVRRTVKATPEEEDFIPLPELPEVVSWTLFAKVSYDLEGKKPTVFAPEIKALAGKVIKVQGYMTALDTQPMQRHFFLSSVPPDCVYCMPAAPEKVVEVFNQHDIEFSIEPIVVQGSLSLLENDEDEVLYQLKNSSLVVNNAHKPNSALPANTTKHVSPRSSQTQHEHEHEE